MQRMVIDRLDIHPVTGIVKVGGKNFMRKDEEQVEFYGEKIISVNGRAGNYVLPASGATLFKGGSRGLGMEEYG